MTKKLLLFTVLVFVLNLIGCQDWKPVEDPATASDQPHFSIFLVKGTNNPQADSQELTKLQIEPQPYLTDRDLVSYNWKDHTLILKQSRPPSQPVPIGTCFVVVAENQRIFMGQFLSPAISSTRSIPVILESDTQLQILNGYPDDTYGKPNDPRKDPRIYKALQAAKILVE